MARPILGLAGERMTKVDTAWLRMDSPGNLMMILGFWTLRPGIGYEALCERVRERLLKYGRFRQRVDQDLAGASWIEDEGFDIHRHVVRESLPRGQARAQLQKRLGELALQPLDHRHPLWQIHLIEHFEGGSALIMRIHHCIADGVALIAVAMSLADGGQAPPPSAKRQAARDVDDWFSEALIRPLTEMASKALEVAHGGAAKSISLLLDPRKRAEAPKALARLGMQVASDAASLLLMPDDSKTRLKGRAGTVKRVAWCDPLPLVEVKAVGKALGCSINDVLLSCVAGAIGGYLRSLGDRTEGQEIRAMIPVNLRPLEQAHKLGNRFGLVPLSLPIGIENPIERVYEVRRRMNALKGSTQPLLAFALLASAGVLAKGGQDALLNIFNRKTTAVMTNVPGPREKIELLGAGVEQCMFWVPQAGDIGLGISVLSYGGGVQFGVITDASLCPEPQKIIEGFEPEFARLSLVTLMLPWDE
ncbi:diacylglycerol O-acyltransferase [Ramlibacter tataouinensis]|uniref:diacylglycerol O-acyltransferase n=2 Tax=Ramlibacter tataouinensis TaxID=94132 RepID=A0A127JZR9_9BURK|nr:diacylglycerol O-acyltransferase [Ramlibacter tataouinensis]